MSSERAEKNLSTQIQFRLSSEDRIRFEKAMQRDIELLQQESERVPSMSNWIRWLMNRRITEQIAATPKPLETVRIAEYDERCPNCGRATVEIVNGRIRCSVCK